MQIMLHGESDRQVISSVFKTEKPLRLELQKRRLHEAIDIVFDKYCVSNALCVLLSTAYCRFLLPLLFLDRLILWLSALLYSTLLSAALNVALLVGHSIVHVAMLLN